MRAKFDDMVIDITPRYEAALIEMMKAECEMMIVSGEDPSYWTWGRARVDDLSRQHGLRFVYGGDDDIPNDGLGDFAVTYE